MEWETGLRFEQIQVAADLARHGTLAAPGRPGNWLVLSHALARLGEFSEAIGCLREAIGMLPSSAKLHSQLAEILTGQDLLEEALPHAEKAVAIAPDDQSAKRLYLELLALLGKYEKVDRESAAAFLVKSARLMHEQAKSLGPEGIAKMCASLLADDPGHINARFLGAIALTRLGRPEEARRLISIDRLIEMQELLAPPGYVDARSFRDALAREIRANPTLRGDPRGKSGRDSLVTRMLRQPDAVAVEALLEQFKQAVDAYEERLVASGDEFAMRRPRQARLQAWAMVYGSNGRQNSHVHPSGWLSGVYYVAAPRPHGENAYRGPLVVGALNPTRHFAAPPWGTREVEPVPGRLVLFPSYVPHATEPSGVDGARISVAFDVVDAAV